MSVFVCRQINFFKTEDVLSRIKSYKFSYAKILK